MDWMRTTPLAPPTSRSCLPAMVRQNGGYGPNCLDFGPVAQCFEIRGEYMFALRGTGQ